MPPSSTLALIPLVLSNRLAIEWWTTTARMKMNGTRGKKKHWYINLETRSYYKLIGVFCSERAVHIEIRTK